ncbi:aspartate 1-decarboxylase [Paenibacillus turpanensis]|uniref:aspartate 1-decarboxylase n=1 Tax=Paenibacillus turpanensis TaxID=2689078 RepID=UPI00140B2707|nr:aspartate 1-decarboxylase [Paenibacillus turpanensis]
MFRTMMKSKIHRATVTEANLNYVGSITIDEDILDAVDIIANEKVQIVNNNNGARLETYVIAGPRGSGVICLNGAAARLVHIGDIVIIIAYGMMTNEEALSFQPKVAIMDSNNRVIDTVKEEIHGTVI